MANETDFTSDALRAAIKQAERHIRINYIWIFLLAGLQALVLGYALKVADFSQSLHVLVVLGFAWLELQMFFILSILAARYDAFNARILRGLELLDERLAER